MPTTLPEAVRAGTARPGAPNTHGDDDAITRGSAFGLELEASFPIPGLASAAGAQRHVRLDLASRAELSHTWSPTAPQRISNRRMPNGRTAVAIDADAHAGYLVRALGFGTFWISPDAAAIRCAPLRVAPWRWQRYLIGQVLPLTAVLRGLEVFHASAVVGPHGALAFLGTSTAGKTSVALSLVLGGARFMTDDVLAVSAHRDGVLAHPGVGLASVRHETDRLLDDEQRQRLGRRLGRDEHATRLALDVQDRPAPLRHAFILDRADAGPLAIEPIRPVDPKLLLGGSFNFIIRTPERLTNQLDLCARLAGGVGIHRAVIPPTAGPAELAHAIEGYVEDLAQ